MYIFDIDGTLLFTIDSISYNINKTLKEFSLGEIEKDKVKSFVGNGPVVLVEKCLEYLGYKDENLKEKFLFVYNKNYDDNPYYLTKPFEGIKQELDKIKARGEKIAAFSNKPDSTCKKVIGHIFGENYFNMVLGYKENYKRKPSAEGIYIIKERLGGDFSDIIYFGDSEVDIKCGKNAGIFTVACAWGFRDKKYLETFNPDLLIENVKEISSIRRV